VVRVLKSSGLAFFLLLTFILLYPACGRGADRAVLDMHYHLGAGYRVDNLNWNIAGTFEGTGPNILSELSWSDITSIQLKGQVRALLFERVYLRAALQGGPIFSGQVQDSDFLGDNRTLEFSRSDNASDSGNVWDVSGALGYRTAIPVLSGSLEVVPLAGLSYHKQNLTLTDGFQTIPPAGSFTGLHSTYGARWYGPWLGGEISYTIADFILRATAEYHYFFYKGLANWNLRTDFDHPVSFKHRAEGSGVLITTAIEYALRDNLGLSLNFEYLNWETDPGNDRTFFANGLVVDTQLNVVNWDSTSLMLALSWSF